MVEPERAVVALQELVAVGVAISLDDYGTGYSSLSMLASLPLTELKIDKSFITRMSPGSTHELITASTVDMAHRLGLRVVAEGVETAEVWSMLQSIGCDVGQGYLFRRPSSNDDFTRWLDERSVAKRSMLADSRHSNDRWSPPDPRWSEILAGGDPFDGPAAGEVVGPWLR